MKENNEQVGVKENFVWENKNNKGATEGRSFKGKVNGIDKVVNDIRYSVNVPTFQSLDGLIEEVKGMNEAAKIAFLSLVNVGVSNAYMNKAVDCIVRDNPVEDWTLESFFNLSGNREGINKSIELAEEELVTLAGERMEALAAVNNILSDVISGKIKMEEAPALQQALTAKVAEIDSKTAEVKARLEKLEVIKAEQAEKNKARGLAAAASRKANAEDKK